MKPFWLRECLNAQLLVDDNFDIVRRDLIIQETGFSFYFIDGFIKDEVMEKMMEFFLKNTFDFKIKDMRVLANHLVPYVEVEVFEKVEEMTTAVLSGSALIYVMPMFLWVIC